MKARTAQTGFTIIELMVAMVIAAILLVVAAPSFVSTLAKRDLEGQASELATDIQYARTEAVQRNAATGIVFGANCYTVYVVGTTNAASCVALGTGAVSLKSVQMGARHTLTFVPANAGTAFTAFEPVRGMAVDAATGTTDLSGYVDVTSSAGNWQVRNVVTRVGRVKSCSPNGTVAALATDCS
jgi:type IV fimbrial biogenesis protein FimT